MADHRLLVGLELEMLRRCKLCRRWKWQPAFRWIDASGVSGTSARCSSCRRRGKRRRPDLPEPRFWIRRHAVERYIERVAPHLTFRAARDEMVIRMADAPMRTTPPPWIEGAYGAAHPGEGSIEGYIYLDADTVLLVGVGRYSARSGPDRRPKVRTVLTANRTG